MTILADLVHDLAASGVAHRVGLDRNEFSRLATELGTVVHRGPVHVHAGARSYLARPAAIPMHTDHPTVCVIGWWCQRQDDADGASLLVDTRPLLEALRAEERASLVEVTLPCPPLDRLASNEDTRRVPVVRTPSTGPPQVYFAPWLRPEGHEAARRVYQLFRTATERAPPRPIRLRPGDALFIDNRRILHGRDAVSPESRRFLERVWVQT